SSRATRTNSCTAPASFPEGLYFRTSRSRTRTSSTADHPGDRFQTGLPILVRDHEGREQTHHRRPRRDREEPAGFEFRKIRRDLFPELHSDHETEPAHFPHFLGGQGAEPREPPRPQAFGPLGEVFAHEIVEGGEARGARERVSSERGVVAPPEARHDLARHDGRADRESAREGFREKENVRDDAPALERKHTAGPAEARLH